MALHDGVRAGRVDERDVAEEVDRVVLLDDVVCDGPLQRLLAET
jgi:hypothetical protein